MRYYKSLTKHDRGHFTLIVNAIDKDSAIKLVMDTEKCPRRSIINIDEVEYINNEWVEVIPERVIVCRTCWQQINLISSHSISFKCPNCGEQVQS